MRNLTARCAGKAPTISGRYTFNRRGSAFSYKGIPFLIADCQRWYSLGRDVPNINIENIALKTATGELRGSASLDGKKPLLSANIEGGSNLSELFAFVDIETLNNPMGFWSGTELTIAQRFNNWDEFEPIGETVFEGNLQLKEVSFESARVISTLKTLKRN